MSQDDYVIENASGATVRADLNNCLAAIVSNNSGATAPTSTFAFQWWVDTSGSPNTLRIRNSANSAWIAIGTVDSANLGLNAITAATSIASPVANQLWIDTSGSPKLLKLRDTANSTWITLGAADSANLALMPLAGGTFTGAVIFNTTGYITLPVGTTAQRPGSPTNGMIRYNTDLAAYEGYSGSAWASIGGGGYTVTSVQSISASGTVTISLTVMRQMRHVQGNAASVTTSTTPFGSSAPQDGTELTLVGNDDTNTVIIPFNDASKGCVGNFTNLEITKYKMPTFIYSASLDRWMLVQGGL